MLSGDGVSHPVLIHDELLQAFFRLGFFRGCDVQWHVDGASSPAPLHGARLHPSRRAHSSDDSIVSWCAGMLFVAAKSTQNGFRLLSGVTLSSHPQVTSSPQDARRASGHLLIPVFRPQFQFSHRSLRSISRHPPLSTKVRRDVCRDVRVANANGERRVSMQAMFAAPPLVDDVPLATASRVADTCPAPAVSCAPPVVVTLAETSHTHHTGASLWIHRANACSTIRFSSTGLVRYTSASCWVRVVRRAREVGC